MKILPMLLVIAIALLNATVGYADQSYQLLLLSDFHSGATSTMDLEPKNSSRHNDLDSTSLKFLLAKLKAFLTSNSIQPNLVLILGDFVDHGASSFWGSYTKRVQHFTEALQAATALPNTPTTPINYVFGNNDSFEGDYDRFYSQRLSPHSPFEVAQVLGWKNGFLNTGIVCKAAVTAYPCLTDENQQQGYYAEYLQPALKLLVVNSILFNHRQCDADCQHELDWLTQQFAEASQAHQALLIAMHIPPGKDIYKNSLFWNQEARTRFYNTVATYPTTLIGILTGHTHMEELQFFKTAGGDIIPIIYVPALSTSHGNLPAFKILTLRKIPDKQWAIADYSTYHFIDGKFAPLYGFNQYYCEGIANKLLSDCLKEKILYNREGLMAGFNNFYTVGNPHFSMPMKSQHLEDYIIELPPKN